MIKIWIKRSALMALVLVISLTNVSPALGRPAKQTMLNLTQYVNPLIGTAPSNSPNPVPGGAGGSTIPGPLAPFGMVQFSPDTNSASPSGYGYNGTNIEEFSMTHFNGAGCGNNEDIGIMPITGALTTSPGNSWSTYVSNFSHSSESAAPGYYRVTLGKYNVISELTATRRTGMLRLTYPSTTSATILINTSKNATGSRSGSISISGSQVTGTFTSGGFCGNSTNIPMFFAAQFDRAPASFGTWLGGTISAGSGSTSGTNSGGYVTFNTTSNAVVQMKIAISYVSIANAQLNLSTENPNWDFAAVRTATESAWNTILNRIQITGGDTTNLTKFYTALYHVFSNPNIFSDVNGQYKGADNVIRTSSRTNYQNYSGWDIIRSWTHLMGAIAPEMPDIMHSMVQFGVERGLLPFWTDRNVETHVMVGDPGTVNVVNAYAMGVRGFDTAAALALMDKSASNTGSTQRANLSAWLNTHWYPGNGAITLEYAMADFALAQYAQALGDTAKYNKYSASAQYWKNNWNATNKYIQARNSDGTWACQPFSPGGTCGFIEGNAAQYTFMIPHNVAGLTSLMGGNAAMVSRLDNLFTELNAGISRPYFYIGNEPEHNQPWMYNFVQAPWRAQDVVRRIIDESFTSAPGGLPGNDDLGATSAWLVWAYLGLYPEIPGSDVLVFNGPYFPSARVVLANGNILTINGGTGAGGRYIQSLNVNGVSTTKNWINFSQLSGGATLNFTMGGSPNMSWGSGAADVPPSYDVGTGPTPTPSMTPTPIVGDLALNKPATADSSCNANEGPAKAVNGSWTGGTTDKWCSLGATKWLQVDLGANFNVNQFVIQHAGAGGESATFNTRDFNIQTSTDNVNWTTRVTVTANTANATTHNITAVSARYIRLNVTTGAQSGANTARIYEMLVFGASGPTPTPTRTPTPTPTSPAGTNLALNKPATADSSCNANEGPAKAVNGSWTGGNSDKWCSLGATKWLQVDLGANFNITQFVIQHAGAGGESATYNTRAFTIQVSTDNVNWTTPVTVTANTANATTHNITAVSARYIRLNVTTGAQSGANTARIYEVQVFGAP